MNIYKNGTVGSQVTMGLTKQIGFLQRQQFKSGQSSLLYIVVELHPEGVLPPGIPFLVFSILLMDSKAALPYFIIIQFLLKLILLTGLLF